MKLSVRAIVFSGLVVLCGILFAGCTKPPSVVKSDISVKNPVVKIPYIDLTPQDA